MKTPLVLSGPPRSGTTLLSSLFDGHTQINWLPDEGYFFEHLHIHRENVGVFLNSVSMGSFISGLRDRAIMPPTHKTLMDFPSLRFNWDEEAFVSALLPRNGSVEELWSDLVDAYLAGFGQKARKYVCLKAADYGRSVLGALRFFGNARCLIIVRNPMDALNSLKRYRQKNDRRLLTWPTMAQSVAEMNELGKIANDLRWIRYEDLTADRQGTMRELAKWLDIPWENALATPTMFGVNWTDNSSFSGARADVLTESEKLYIRQCARPFCERFGYKFPV